ncbi:MAG TPA: gamma carbonic anhydrase family protein [Thermomicrobiales bacterium]|nr:gamma carbonic anhydrase family protein [Thermomicrobiales bacterium]HRA46597.1 gamma carbonic anhydrase family protein [Thermomicrobiales bacterium]
MIIEHEGQVPRIHPTAYIAPNAVISGDVEIGAESRVLFGAVITADGGPVRIGTRVTVMENALIRGRARFASMIGDFGLVGPHAHLNGTRIGAKVFVGTGATFFPGSVVGDRAVVRNNGIVHVNTHLPADAVVPIGWIALGHPVSILPPDEHDEITRLLAQLRFRETVYGVDSEYDADSEGSLMPTIAERNAVMFGRHVRDKIVG